MAEITLQGTLVVGSNELFKCASGKTAKVKYIKLYNSIAYTVTLSKFDFDVSSTIDLYSLTLDPGDSVSDDTQYLLQGKDSISVTNSAVNTTFLILLEVV